MGQYYVPLTVEETGEVKAYSLQENHFRETKDFDYYNGVKLMEHSWIGNRFCDTFSSMLYHHKLRVAWVGDYSYNLEPEEIANAVRNGFENFYELAWGEGVNELDVEYESFDYTGKVLVNWDSEEYLEFDEIEDHNGWKIYPLSLLTSIGNGHGGGDYRGWNRELCGTWAFDLVSIEDKAPDGFFCCSPDFEEN